MYDALVRIATEAWMLMKPGVSAQDVVSDEETVVAQILNGLHKGANRTKIGADFGLGKDGSYFHSGGSLARSFPLAIWRPDVRSPPACAMLVPHISVAGKAAPRDQTSRLKVQHFG